MSKQLFEMQQELSMINNVPQGFREDDYYPQYSQGSIAYRVKRVEPLTDKQRIAQAEAFAYIDEYDKRNRGQQFED